jgi:hypothetical protein
MQLASITFDGKKVESFIIPPILEKRLLYSRSNKTIDKPCIYTNVETQQMVAEKKDEIRALFLVQNRGPIR